LDFFRPGLGLSLVVLVVSMIEIPIAWPLAGARGQRFTVGERGR